MSTKPRYALAGTTADQLPSSFKEQLEFVSLGSSDISGVLIAGASEAGARTAEEVSAFLDAGLAVASFKPDETVGNAIATAAGRIAVPAPLILYRRSGGGITSSIAGEWTDDSANCVAGEPAAEPSTEPATESAASSNAAPAGVFEAPARFFAPKRALLKRKDPDPAPPAPTVTVVENFTPPNRAAYFNDYHLVSEEVEQPKDIECDKIMNSTTVLQRYQYIYRADFHVYWHDGESVAKPHFVLILKQTCMFDPCFSGRTQEGNYTWEGWSKAFFMAMVDLEPPHLVAHGAKDFQLADWAPKGDSLKGGKDFKFSYPMQLRVDNGQGGRSNSVKFNAQYENANLFEDWKYRDRVNLSEKKPSWRFHLDRFWDPTRTPREEFGNWHMHMFNPDHVVDFGPQCINPIYMTSVAAWTIQCDTRIGEGGAVEPVPVTLEMIVGIKPMMTAMHARAGCVHSARHLWWRDRPFHYRKFLRLDDICKR